MSDNNNIYVNNHIHTTYSFSPYTPAEAVYAACASGLTTAGIMDHDAVAGAYEFVRAGKEKGIATTVGFECRCSMKGTPFADIRLNNPDQKGVAYVACHGIPHQNIEKADLWLAPYRELRLRRDRAMTERINALTDGEALALDFDRDILPLSMYSDGGTVTERHLLYALALKLVAVFGRGESLLDFLDRRLGIELSDSDKGRLLSAEESDYVYRLLGILKGNLVEKFFIDATDECPSIFEFVRFVTDIGAIPAYAYLGDVGKSVTGDKKAKAYEDGYLDELIAWIAANGFRSVTYMPTRNTPAQLARIMKLCEKENLFQISGEDINSPDQSFICEALALPEFRHLVESTWALIGHEKAASLDVENGMFRSGAEDAWPYLNERIKRFAEIGRGDNIY
jgi:hypothetical protein